MTARELELELTEFGFVSIGLNLRKEGKVILLNQDNAREFLVKFLVLETTSGVNYSDTELLETYYKLEEMVKNKSEILSEELPYHRLKTNHIHHKKFVLNGCDVYIVSSTV